MYVCPKCKGPLSDSRCPTCRLEFPVLDGIPCFLSDPEGASGRRLREIYDEIYRHSDDVWIGQGRSPEFLQYFCNLARASATANVLEIGCGEGMLLAALPGANKYGIDPSVQALVKAKKRSAGECAVARAEELPFPAESFDLVVTVGVMEHFEDPDAATTEICRVLKPSGCYIALIETDMTWLERLATKARMYLWPQFRPLAFLKWASRKLRHRIVQPLRRSYSAETARRCLEHNGLELKGIITRGTQPRAPLAGDHVVILLSRKG